MLPQMEKNQSFSELLAAFRCEPLALCRKIPGVWLVNKPSGPSSNLVVVRARKALRTKRIGHAGTLDPMASGLLVLLAGNATRLFDAVQEYPKTYVAGFRLYERTDSQDTTGTPLADWFPQRKSPPERTEVEDALARFSGEILQVPPMHSALKKGGQPLYKLARRGQKVERAARPVTAYRIVLLEFDGTEGRVEMDVSKGFYVRTLIDDFGLALGCGAVMTSLCRTRVGPFDLSDAAEMDALGEIACGCSEAEG